jgi:hypothetical protein
MRARLILLLVLLLGGVALLGLHWMHPHATAAALLAHPPAASRMTGAPAPARIHPPLLAAGQGDAGSTATAASDPDPVASYEELMYAQPDLVDASLARLRAQVPGRVDLYALGFAGDGEEPPFRNEVDALSRLMTQHFGAPGHTIELINSPRTFERTPLATRTNLYQALAGIAKKMDVNEDVLLLFLTSHGSPDHELYVEMGAMPLDQLTPEDIRDALDAAGIRWRIVVVSACYSGGFIPALRDPRTLVITAARSDRASFGCGNDSKITWFGKAFLAEALERTTDFHAAYLQARQTIAGWETRDHETPSEPQYWAGAMIGQKLQAWRAAVAQAAGAKPGTVVASSKPADAGSRRARH